MKHTSILYTSVIFIICASLILVLTSAWINYNVANNCKKAQTFYSTTDCVAALIKQVDDEHQPYSERNSAIWALGQTGNGQALPVLKRYYTGEIPDKESWNETLSQYELHKAINLLEGGFNLAKIFD